jgi:hypothetical protein
MVAYNERILETSLSPQRIHRARQMLANVRPHLERLEHAEQLTQAKPAIAPACWRDASGTEYETIWNGGGGLSSYRQREGQGYR